MMGHDTEVRVRALELAIDMLGVNGSPEKVIELAHVIYSWIK
jgi:hypothetical protein